MKSSKEGIIIPIDNKEIKELLSETNETIASGFLKSEDSFPKFGIIDLWRMQKKHKTLGSSIRW